MAIPKTNTKSFYFVNPRGNLFTDEECKSADKFKEIWYDNPSLYNLNYLIKSIGKRKFKKMLLCPCCFKPEQREFIITSMVKAEPFYARTKEFYQKPKAVEEPYCADRCVCGNGC